METVIFHAASVSLLAAGIQHIRGPDIREQILYSIGDTEFAEEYAVFSLHPRLQGQQEKHR